MDAVLVTGGAGYIGAHAAKALAEKGFLPVVLDTLEHGFEQAVKWGPLIRANAGDIDAVRSTIKAHNIQSIMHFAAFIEVGLSTRDPAQFYVNNTAKALRLIQTGIEAGIKSFVFSSTAAVYGEPLSVPIAEDHPCNPVNPYGATKLAVEQALQWCARAYDFNFAALRYFNAAGADASGEIGEAHDPETHLIPLAVDAGLNLRPALKIFGEDYDTPDGTAVRDYVHVSDIADAHVLALNHLQSGGGSLVANLGTGTGYSVKQILNSLGDILGAPVPAQAAARRAGDPPILVADPTKAEKRLGWQRRNSDLHTILKSAVHWHRSPTYGRVVGAEAPAH